MMRNARSEFAGDGGFTLLETLIALFVISILSAAGAALLFTTLQGGKQVEAHTDVLRQMEITHALMRDDIAAMTERRAVPPNGYEEAQSLIGEPGGSEGLLMRFTRSGWSNPDAFEARSDLQRIEYRLENGNLVRTVWLRPDATGSTPRTERVLATGLERVDLKYAKNGEWSDVWRQSELVSGRKLPDVIEISWTYTDQDRLLMLFPAGGHVS